jgi:hypothetical protein
MLREIPQAGFKINFQTNPTITTDKMVGVKMIHAPRILVPSRAARNSPTGFWTSMWMTKKRALFRKAFQNGFAHFSWLNSAR